MSRFWSKVEQTADCWEWTAAKDRRGYGKVQVNGRAWLAHRWAYESTVAVVPEGMELDHLCRNPGCVRPDHLEPVTHAENVRRGQGGHLNNWQRRKTYCPQGHPLNDANVFHDKQGWRHCRTCHNARNRRRRARI